MRITLEVFLSHADEDKKIARQIADEMIKHGVNVFVAHDDIEPGANWKSVLTEKINQCDVFLILLTKNFHPAEWTEQEVGIAHAFKKRMVPVRFDNTVTTGFMTDYQATQISYPINPDEMKNLVDIIIAYSDEVQRQINEMIDQLRVAGSFSDANSYARILFKNKKFTTEQINRLADAYLSNYEIQQGYVAGPKCQELFANNWSKIEQKYKDALEPHLKEI